MFRVFRKLFGGSVPARSGTQRHMIDVCPDCGAAEGQLHEMFCLKERCPFCGGQLATCECLGRVLQLTPEDKQLVDEYVDDSTPAAFDDPGALASGAGAQGQDSV